MPVSGAGCQWDCANKLKAKPVCVCVCTSDASRPVPGVYHISQSINITVHIFITFLFEYFNMQTQQQASVCAGVGGVQFPACM